ncbi:6931_t:CDS:2 [Cetraspora pellucida]|uniref:6931_t:CDS:1 n=1 Tax=Cetraspora pellucida TaxID=1433469 RepID=A0ACA9KYU8_9GLOM|nr:6931_t:CDS:2 [Cetraspora pellucida]
MSNSESDENKVVIEVKEFKIENKDLSKDFAISPKGDFVVKFMVNDEERVNGEEKYDLQMYTVDGNGSKLDDFDPNDMRSSYRNLSRIPATFNFTDKQLGWIKKEDENILRWSVAVSDKSTSSPEFRLLAISCTNLKDMKSYQESLNEKQSVTTLDHGLTFVFVIENDYSISPIKDREISFKYGGIVKLFSITNPIVEKDNKRKIDNSSQSADEHFLIILTITGVYKYHIKNKYVNSKQKLKYPKRMYYAINDILNFFFWVDAKKLYEFVLGYIYKCLSKHYLLVDTEKKGLEYIELYDLKTNQLVNTFKKQVSNRPIKFDRPSYHAVSNNGKLFAYLSFAINGIKIYLTECGLEIAKLVDIFDKEMADDLWRGKKHIVIDFFPDDNDAEKLFVYCSEKKWFVWDIFSLFRSSIKLKNPGFKVQLNNGAKISNNLIVVDQDDKLNIYDDLIIRRYLKNLKKNDDQSWKELSRNYFSREDLSNKIRDLHGKELEFSKEEFKKYQNFEPWSIIKDNIDLRYSFYLDDERKKLLLIGSHTIQVWYEQDEKKSLEFIYAPMSHWFHHNAFKTILDLQLFEKHSALKVIDIKYCIGKFKLNIKFPEGISVKLPDEIPTIKMEDEDDLMNVVKYACYTLNYFSVYKEFEHVFLPDEEKDKLDFIIKQTKKIIWRFIKSHPTAWRLLDIHYDLMSVLIEAKDYELVNDILSFSKLVHIPHDVKTIHNALSDYAMLALFLEYYSNNAINNIGWMNTVVDIMPELCDINEKEEDDDNNIISKLFKSEQKKREKEKESYVQKLFNHPCFCSKQLDLLSFEFLEISPALSGLLKVFIPITQLIPQKSELDLQEIDFDKIIGDKIDDIRMVPLPNFTTKKKMPSDISDTSDISNVGKRSYSIFRNLVMLPILSSQDYEENEHNSSPFIKIIKDIKLDILCENPSMSAVMNWIFILLGFSFYIGLTDSTTTGEESDNPFTNIIASILAVYDWSSISFNAWNFWPLTIIGVLGSFLFVIILQNVIISFMSDAITDAVNDSRSIYSYQVDFIRDFALLDRILKFHELDFKLKDKLRAKFICFYDDPSITSLWKEKSEQRSKPSSEMQTFKSEYKYVSIEGRKFIWEEKDETVDSTAKKDETTPEDKMTQNDKIKYWFFEDI